MWVVYMKDETRMSNDASWTGPDGKLGQVLDGPIH
jgi:hypothetical protein